MFQCHDNENLSNMDVVTVVTTAIVNNSYHPRKYFNSYSGTDLNSTVLLDPSENIEIKISMIVS